MKKGSLKPLPDFTRIQLEANAQHLKIKEFFCGDPFTAKAKKMKELEALRNEELEMARDESAFGSHSFTLKGRRDEDGDIVRVLPTVDSQSQMEIRRKIFYEKEFS